MKIFKRLLLFLSAFVLILLVWGLVEPYFINLEKEDAVIPNLPEAWEGEKIAVVGDFQIGMWLDNDSAVEKMAEQLVDLNPSAVLFLGDYVYHSVKSPAKERERVKELIKPLTDSDIPIFAVLGNHDYAMTSKKSDPNQELAQDMKSSLQEMEITVLHNEAVPLTLIDGGLEQENASSESLHLVGIGAAWPENVEPSKAFDGVPDSAARFVMMHNPETFEDLRTDSAPMSVAGHTHGGQMKVPYTPQWSFIGLMSEGEDNPIYGWIENYGAAGNQLYINPGIGFSILPMRINCPPEITLFTLKSA